MCDPIVACLSLHPLVVYRSRLAEFWGLRRARDGHALFPKDPNEGAVLWTQFAALFEALLCRLAL